MNQIVFKGRGGGGGGGDGGGASPPPQTQTRTPDNLRSEDAFELIMGICEGPIDGCETFYVGDTPLYNADGSSNFADFNLTVFAGDFAPEYTIIPTLGGAPRGVNVGVTLSQNVPIVRSTQGGQIDFIDVRLIVSQLYMQNSNGIYTNTLDFKIEYKATASNVWLSPYATSLQTDTNPTSICTGFSVDVTPPTDVGSYDSTGAWVGTYLTETVSYRLVGAGTWTTLKTVNAPSTCIKEGLPEGSYEVMISGGTVDSVSTYKPDSQSISGKTTSNYVKELRFPVDRISGTYDIRVTKLSPENDADNVRLVGWESFQEVVSSQYKWPNTAAIQLTGRASNQFAQLPQFSGIWRGLKIKVPTNYDPIAKTYTGLWDGTFKTAWSDNPAWCLYDFVTNGTFGIASYYPIFLDKYSVYTAGQWCDERMSDGSVRYTFNALIADQRSGREQAVYMAGVFNGVFFDDQNGTAFIKVDKDDPAMHLFTRENTVDGFGYSFTDVTTRYNDITVTFVNPDMGYQEDRRRVYNQDDIDANGRVPYDFIAVGCNNAAEAMRRAAYKLLTGITEVMAVTFKTNRLGMHVQPWEVILCADPTIGYAISGRIKTLDSTRTVITLRDPAYLEVGVSYVIKFDYFNEVLERNLVHPSSGNNYTLTVDAVLPSDIPEHCTFSIEGGTLGTPKPFRVLKITEAEGNPDAFEINAIEINRNKWTQSDSYTDTSVIQYSSLSNPLLVPGPTAVKFTENFNKSTKQFELMVEPTLDRSAYHFYNGVFEVWSRLKGSGTYEQRTLTNGDTVVNHPAGLYEFKILPFSYVGGRAELTGVSSYEYDLTNPADPPADVSWLQLTNQWLQWSYPNPPLDFAGFELRYSLDGRLLWDTGVNATPGSLIAAPPFALPVVPQGAVGLMLKAVDYFGNYSVNQATVLVNVGDMVVANIVETFDYKADGFDGQISNGTVSGGNLQSQVVPGSKFYTGVDAHPEFTGVSTAPFYALPHLQLDYVDNFVIGAGGYLSLDATISGGSYQVFYREYGERPMYDGGLMYLGGGALMYTQDPWLPFTQRTWITAGEYEIKVSLPAKNNVSVISQLAAVIDVDDVKESLANVAVGSMGTRLPITKQYTSIKVVNLTLQYDSGTAYTVRVLDKDPVNGPLVKVLDLSGNPTTGHVDAVIEGYFV